MTNMFAVLHSHPMDQRLYRGLDATIRAWDASTGVKLLPPLLGHERSVESCVTFSADGSKIASGSSDKTIRVWDASIGVETLAPLKLLRGDQSIRSVAFSNDGSKIASRDWYGIRVWDVNTSTGEVSPPQEDASDAVLKLMPDYVPISLDKRGWFTDATTGCLLPIDASYYGWQA